MAEKRTHTMQEQELIDRFCPRLYFHPDETCFPLDTALYLSKTQVLSRSDPTRVVNPTPDALYQFRKQGTSNLYLEFVNPETWENELKGNPNDAYCYVRVLQKSDHRPLMMLVYFYLFSHTEAYSCCGGCSSCCPKFMALSHKADLKYIGVEVNEYEQVSRVYYGAHGSTAGQWRKASQIEFCNNTHPIVYSTLGDHSFYPKPTKYPRIFGCVVDECGRGLFCDPIPRRILDEDEYGFNQFVDGWALFPGKMNVDGIDAPAQQNFWNGNFSKSSNNWFRRLFCPSFW